MPREWATSCLCRDRWRRTSRVSCVGKGDAEAQVEQIFKNMQAVLAAGGSSLERVGKINILTTSMEYLPAIRAVRDRVFAPVGQVPASTLAIISSLAHPDYLVEIEVVAAIG